MPATPQARPSLGNPDVSGREEGFLTSGRPWPSGPFDNPMIPSDRPAAAAKPAERPEEAVPGSEAATGVECRAETSSAAAAAAARSLSSVARRSMRAGAGALPDCACARAAPGEALTLAG